MIQMGSILETADNTGIISVKCIHVNGSTGKHVAKIGDIVILSVKKTSSLQHKKGSIKRGVVVRSKFPIKRKDGSTIRFSNNAVAILNNSNEPVGTRIFGPIAKELKSSKSFAKIVSLAPELL
jgi:large subunit ribosomal protein L14